MDKLAQASGASQHASSRGRPRLVETPAAMEQLMDEISQLGHVPTRASTASAKEKRLYFRLARARTVGSLTKEQEAAFDKLAQASRTKVVQQVRDLGHYPKANAGRSLAERQLAWKLRTVVNAKQLSPEQEAELQALRRLSRRTDMRKRPPGGWGPDGPPQRLLELAENGRAAIARKQAGARRCPSARAVRREERGGVPSLESSNRRCLALHMWRIATGNCSALQAHAGRCCCPIVGLLDLFTVRQR